MPDGSGTQPFIVDVVPFAVDPPQLGGQIVIRAVNACLPAEGYAVSQFSMGIRRTDLSSIGRVVCRTVAPGYVEWRRTEPLSVLAFLASAILRTPYFWAHRMLDLRPWPELRSHISRSSAVLVEMPWCYSPAQIQLPPGAPLVYVAQNAEYQLAADWRNHWRDLGARLAASAERSEARMLQHADLIFAISAEDAQALAQRYTIDADRMHVVPRGLDLARYEVFDIEQRQRQRHDLGLAETESVVVFAGSRHPPNVAAAQTMLRLAQELGDGFRCIVAGSIAHEFRDQPNTSAAGSAWFRPGDPKPWLQVADIAVNPMAAGSGMNVKMLEYLAFELPVVTTATGARGIDGQDGRHFRVAALSDFAQAVRSLAGDSAERRRLAEAGFQLVQIRYSATATAKRMVQLINAWRSQPSTQVVRHP